MPDIWQRGIVMRLGRRDYGFIQSLENDEVFWFHLSFVDPDVVLKEGDQVDFLPADILAPVHADGRRPVSRVRY